LRENIFKHFLHCHIITNCLTGFHIAFTGLPLIKNWFSICNPDLFNHTPRFNKHSVTKDLGA